MKKIILPAFLVLMSVYAFAQTGEKNFIDQPYIEVTGTAEMEIVPDMIYLKIIISESDTKGKISLESLEKKMIQRLTENGIDVSKDLTVSDLRSSYIKYFLKEKDVVATRSYVLLVHDAATAGKALKALSEEEISNISIINVDHSQMAQKRFDVRLDAVKAAKTKASAMAGAVDQSIGKAIYISEVSNENYVQSNANIRIRGAAEINENNVEMTYPNLEFKNITIRSSVQLRFALN